MAAPRVWPPRPPRQFQGSQHEGGPLAVTFDRPLDRALLERCLWVHDADGTPLAGRGSVEVGECGWQFVPQIPWASDGYELIIDPRLEDLAGNSLVRVFDRDLNSDADEPGAPLPVALPFTCPAQPRVRATMHAGEGAER